MKHNRVLALLLVLTALMMQACQPSAPPLPPQTSATETKSPNTPPVTDPPQTLPPVTDPPVTNPPVTNPPVTNPPETIPPDTDPPVTEPSDNYPPEYAYPELDMPALYPSAVLAKTEHAGDDYRDQLVFLGDSTTYGMRYYGILKGGKKTGQVWVPANGTLTLNNVPEVKIYLADEDIEITLNEALARRKPGILVITLGLNGVAWMGKTVFVREYTEIIDAVRTLSPSTQIIMQSIFPIRPEYKNQESINNQKIAQANLWIAELAQVQGIPFLNTAEVLLNEHGYLKTGYDSGDGMHLMPAVYREILEYVLTHRVPGYVIPEKPPVTEPTVTEPPVTEPPVTEPTVTEPTVTEPNVTTAPEPQPDAPSTGEPETGEESNE